MGSQAYQLIFSIFGVGTILQTIIFYFILFLLFRIILTQLNFSINIGRINFIQRWMEGRLQK